jgi:predicted DNA-binding transcriptional regulator AlpA
MEKHDDDVTALPERARTTTLLRRLDISRPTLYRWLADPTFPRPAVVGGLRLYDLPAVRAWLRGREARPTIPARLAAVNARAVRAAVEARAAKRAARERG